MKIYLISTQNLQIIHTLIESSGLQGNQYLLKEKFNKQLKILLAGRLLEDKGIKKYINLASQMNSDNVKFYLAGELDEGNPKSLTQRDLEDIKNNKFVEYLRLPRFKKRITRIRCFNIFI